MPANSGSKNLNSRTGKRSLAKQSLFYLLLILITIFILEIGFRVIFSFRVGPSVLLYGTSYHVQRESDDEIASLPEAKTAKSDDRSAEDSVTKHKNKAKGYTKYFPNQTRYDFDIESGERFAVTINSNGFRGKDYVVEKEPGTVRIVTLGASSTFGYFDRDNETYPVYLEQILNAGGDGKYEVINLGIPHLTAKEIYYLYQQEALPLDPDIVTFYEGNNDVYYSMQRRHFKRTNIKPEGTTTFDQWQSKFIVLAFLGSLSGQGDYEAYSGFLDHKANGISEKFLKYVARINNKSSERGISFIVANQQKNSQTYDRGSLKNFTYAEEQKAISEKLDATGRLAAEEMRFLVHGQVMQDLEDWAKSNDVPFIDIIGALDQRRDVLVSWVHLSPEGNRMIAEKFAEKILQLTDSSSVQ